ncbi:TolC family protein [Sphingomonas sp. SUN039]|uniref:TolC family protein n=1 Tax=Sphingomonas sp. SUN039 TaxID=2937787 RepID=UPI002164BB84|nr:TolC family protein [Sphingomonas sp. SUN039]UVO55785.1 TolC family protein [Sphingomonas sp. SUN039]
MTIVATSLVAAGTAIAQVPSRAAPDLTDRSPVAALPAPTIDPLAIVAANDPVLGLSRSSVAPQAFRDTVGAAVRRAPLLGESIAQRQESEAARNEARARQYPTVDLSLTHFEVVSRAFSNDPQNILERQRPQYRTDGSLRLTQPLFDFGASSDRIRAGNARLQAANANIEDTGSRVAMQAIAVWYNVFAYRTLVRLGESFAAGQVRIREDVETRIRQGATARGDAAQVDSSIASSQAQLADFRRALASAEAQFTQLTGAQPPPSLGRAPTPDLGGLNAANLSERIDALPAVRAAKALARAADEDAKAVRADAFPTVSAGVDAGRYGILQNARDYDVRASVSMNWRLFGGATQRIDQAEARASAAGARLQRAREESERDARIALADVGALEDSAASLGSAYLASRQSRDVLIERFRVSRGALTDVLTAQSNYFGVAARYVQAVIELDTARYTLLARTGKLLEALAIPPAALDPR